jgi:hypothetical protein
MLLRNQGRANRPKVPGEILLCAHPLRSRDWLAGAEGIEPSNAGIKIQCLTTWRRPTRVAPYKASRARPQTGLAIGQMPGQTRVFGPVAGLGGHRYKDAS